MLSRCRHTSSHTGCRQPPSSPSPPVARATSLLPRRPPCLSASVSWISSTPGQWGPGCPTSPSRVQETPLPSGPPGSPEPSRRCPSRAIWGRACPGCRRSGIRCPLPVCSESGGGSARAAGAARIRLGSGPSAATVRPPSSGLGAASGGRFLPRSVGSLFPRDFGSARPLAPATGRKRAELPALLSRGAY